MRLLLAIDDSKFSDAATQTVIAQYQPQGTQVKILNVVDLAVRIPTSYAAGFREEGLKHGQEIVRRAEQVLKRAGYTVQTAVEQGDPKSKIIDQATQWNAELIVMGSHGRKGIARFLMGSVAEGVVRHAPCSVEIVRMPKHTEKLKAIKTPAGFENLEFEPGCHVADSEHGIFAVDSIVVHAESLGFQPPPCNCESCGKLGSWSECEFPSKVEDEANDYLNKHFKIVGYYWGRNKNADWGLWPVETEH